MESKVRLLGHPVHPMLIVFPLGLLATSVIFDILELITGNEDFYVAAAYVMAAGIVGGLVAALVGLLDWLAIPRNTRARSVGRWHGLGNLTVVLLFAASWLIRAAADGWDPNAAALVLGFAGFALAGVSGWLGGELVDRLGVGVDPGADLNAPSSLGWRRRQRNWPTPHVRPTS